jgi:hypothetical protein
MRVTVGAVAGASAVSDYACDGPDVLHRVLGLPLVHYLSLKVAIDCGPTALK